MPGRAGVERACRRPRSLRASGLHQRDEPLVPGSGGAAATSSRQQRYLPDEPRRPNCRAEICGRRRRQGACRKPYALPRGGARAEWCAHQRGRAGDRRDRRGEDAVRRRGGRPRARSRQPQSIGPRRHGRGLHQPRPLACLARGGVHPRAGDLRQRRGELERVIQRLGTRKGDLLPPIVATPLLNPRSV
jgi:hypothetical protein